MKTYYSTDDENYSHETVGDALDAARLLALEAAANQIFNDPPSETSQDVRDVIEWFSGCIRVVLNAARKQGANHD